MIRVDINCDLGEGIGNDAAVMPCISSANIACGYHAGNVNTMDQTLQLAMEHKVAIGAHPGFNDSENFGRKAIKMTEKETEQLVCEQILLLHKRGVLAGCQLSHVKPHGALYNMAASDYSISLAIARGIRVANPKLSYYGLANSPMQEAAREMGLKFVSEVFADRAYTNEGLLVPRHEQGAVIHDVELCKKRVLQMLIDHRVESIEGKLIPIKADSICIHGDNPEAVELALTIHTALIENQIRIVSPHSTIE